MEEIQISSPLVWKEIDAEKILIGKVISKRSYTRLAMEAILQKAWNMQDGFNVVEINGNSFMFKFASEEEFNRILCCPTWVQIHNVPMEAMCLENAITIGGQVGEVMLVEDPHYNGRFLRSFLCARVVLDLKKPLVYGFWLPRPDGKKVWLSVRYEKLQCFCYNCGKIGHDNRSCGSERLMSVVNPNEPCFGTWITTTACCNWEEVLVVVKSDWLKAKFVRRRKEEALRRRQNEDS
ncbi:hypothetical protein K1719_035891 [Acacia pycnantha]|nr:hypothetical protein K1719_035891 [Acacia pycnantha]